MVNLYTVIFVIIILISPYLYELYLSLIPRRHQRQYLYQMASKRAKKTGKKLLVIGDPDAGCINHYLGRDYDCGDLCIDLTGCPKCPRDKSIKGSCEEQLPKLATNSYVVFVSCTLEYVNDLELVIRELNRVSGGDLFIVNVEPYSPLHFLFKGTRQIITKAPPYSKTIQYQEVPGNHKVLQKIYGVLAEPFMKGNYNSN